MTENADLQSRVVELQSRHQVKGSVLVYDIFVAPVICVMAPPIHQGAWSMALSFLFCSVEREFQSLVSVVQTKDRGLAEAQQQLRQKVNS